MKNKTTYQLMLMALFMTLCYVGTMFNIPFAIGGVKTMIHLGNVFCLLGALVLGGVPGGISASIGMGIFDLSTGWAIYAPSTFILKFGIAWIAGTLFFHLKKKNWKLTHAILLSTFSGMVFNIIFSPIASFLTSRYLMGTNVEIASIMMAWQSITVFINAAIAITVSYVLYMLLKPIIQKENHRG